MTPENYVMPEFADKMVLVMEKAIGGKVPKESVDYIEQQMDLLVLWALVNRDAIIADLNVSEEELQRFFKSEINKFLSMPSGSSMLDFLSMVGQFEAVMKKRMQGSEN